MISEQNLLKHADILYECARAMQRVTRDYFWENFHTKLDLHWKKDASPLVTEADCASEEAARKVVEEKLGDTVHFIGEETGTILAPNGSRITYVFDGIDGTSAFTIGRPTYTNLGGVMVDGRPMIGFISQPNLDIILMGVTGMGTFEIIGDQEDWKNGKRLCITQNTNAVLERATMACCTTHAMFHKPAQKRAYEALVDKIGCTVGGGDGYNYLSIAKGLLGVEFASGLKMWDWVGCLPVVVEAGGVMTDFKGQPLVALNPETDDLNNLQNFKTEILASSQKTLHIQALDVIKDVV